MLGKLGSMRQLGVYSIAVMFATLPVGLLSRVGTFAVFPALSRRFRDDAEGRAAVYRRIRQPMLALAGLIVAITFASARPLITLLYDPRYGAAGYMLELLAIGAWVRTLEITPQAALLALGEPRWLALGNGVKVGGLVVGVPIGFYFAGFAGAIYGLIASNALRYALVMLGVSGRGLRSVGVDLLLTAMVMAAGYGGYLAGQEIDPAYLKRLAVTALTATALWAPAALLLLRGELAARGGLAALRNR
jgi:O-antigen/teichoic acid export membrane protein